MSFWDVFPYTLLSLVPIAWLALHHFRKYREAEEQLKRMLAEFGFTDITATEPDIIGKIRETKNRRYQVNYKRIYKRSRMDCTIYYIEYTVGKEKAERQRMMVLESPYLDLPRFTLYPRLVMGRFLGKLLTRILSYAFAGRNTRPIPLTSYPEFDKAYMLYGSDSPAVNQIFSGAVVRHIMSRKHNLYIEANKDVMVVSPVRKNGQKRYKTFGRELLNVWIEDTHDMFRLFRSGEIARQSIVQ